MKKLSFLLLSLMLALSGTANATPTTLSNSTYDAFSASHFSDGVLLHVFRQATTHASDKGKLVGQKFTCADTTTCASGSWATRYDIYTDSTYDVRDPVMIENQGHLWLFFTKYDFGGGNQVSSGYIVSTDLTGTSWSSYTELYAKEAAIEGFNFHNGAATFWDTPGSFMIPWAKHDDTGPVWSLIFWKTTDYGAHWSQVTVYSGSTLWVEPSVCYIGKNRLVAVARDNSGAYLGYTISSDGGATWSAMATSTILGNSTSVKPAVIYYDKPYDNIIVAYLDRGGGASDAFKYTISQDAYWTFQNKQNFPATTTLDSNNYNNSGNGYPAIERLSPTKIMIIWSKQASTNVSNILYEILDSGISTTPALFGT